MRNLKLYLQRNNTKGISLPLCSSLQFVRRFGASWPDFQVKYFPPTKLLTGSSNPAKQKAAHVRFVTLEGMFQPDANPALKPVSQTSRKPFVNSDPLNL